jgi:hypothetical protein
MSGKGKYTSYVDPTERGKAKATRLGKLFLGSPFVKEDGTPLDAAEALGKANEAGNTILRAENIEGNNLFDRPVNMRYKGIPDGATAPTVDEEPQINGKPAKEVPGGPLNRYVPNLKSPGAGASGPEPDELGTVNLNPSTPGGDAPVAPEPDGENTRQPGTSRVEITPFGE